MGDKYKTLKELIAQWIKTETENMEQARPSGIDSAGFNAASGAIEAYNQVLSDIAELEREAVLDY